MNEEFKQLNLALDTVTMSTRGETKDVKSLALSDFMVDAVFPIPEEGAFVGLVHKNTPVKEFKTQDSQLLIDIKEPDDFDDILYATLKAFVYKQTNTTEHDPVLDNLIKRGITNSKLTTANLVTTIIQLS